MRLRRLIQAGALCLFAATTPEPIAATNFVVSTANDAGAGSFRAAIEAANADVLNGPHQISFNIPGIGVHRIALLSQLPDLFPTVTIDGFTQPGATPNAQAIGNDSVLLVEIDGSALPANEPMLVLRGDGSVVRGVSIFGVPGAFGSALFLRASQVVIEGCFIGLDAAGNLGGAGDSIADLALSGGHRIGGPLPSQRNVISGARNRHIVLASADNVIQGNYIGTDPSGTTSVGTQGSGVVFFAGNSSNNLVGGPNPGEGNVLSGLGGVAAIAILGSLAATPPSGNVFQGNMIGTDPTGTIPIPNTGSGITVNDSVDTTVGGSAPGEGNVIANNGLAGVAFALSSSGATVHGNRIGVGTDGSAMPNDAWGVRLTGSERIAVGGVNAGEGNIIAYTEGTPGVGVSVAPDLLDGQLLDRNPILGNSIFGSRVLGIDLFNAEEFAGFAEGPTLNDALDEDVGANQLQNHPVVLDAFDEGATWRLVGELNSAPNQTYRVELFSTDQCHPTGYGEGRTPLGSLLMATDNTGFGAFEAQVAAPPLAERSFSATATDVDGNTSEFGRCLAPDPLAVPTAGTFSKLLLTLLIALYAVRRTLGLG